MEDKINLGESENPQNEAPPVEICLPQEFVRFSPLQRIEHLSVMIFFLVLVITGLPQEFFENPWAAWIIVRLGGIDTTRFIHRIFGILFAALAVWHLGRVTLLVILIKARPSMIPTFKDFSDAVGILKYYLGLSKEQPKFDRYDYRQKFEYWGLMIGGIIMIVTGFILYLPVFFTKLLPGVIIPVAKFVHGYEALLAFLVIIIWHMYGAHFNPGAFPFDSSIFTGKISRERMEKEHSQELARLLRSWKR
ncbi:MAG: formate dehydrogenase subunit gamma [Ignavibacteriales bacterium]|jgi:formate dehydrogenase gamma subunit